MKLKVNYMKSQKIWTLWNYAKVCELLKVLLENKNIVVNRDTLLQKVCGYDYMGETNLVDVYVRHIRNKLDEKYDVKMIKTVRGVGYVIKDE